MEKYKYLAVQAFGDSAPVVKDRSTVNALILINGKVPVFKRSKDGESWCDVPGGKRDPIDPENPSSRIETVFEATERELLEELGIKATAIQIVDIMAHPFIEGATKTFVYCEHVSGEPGNVHPDQHDDLLLVEPAEAIALLGNRITDIAAWKLLKPLPASGEPSVRGVNHQRPGVFGT